MLPSFSCSLDQTWSNREGAREREREHDRRKTNRFYPALFHQYDWLDYLFVLCHNLLPDLNYYTVKFPEALLLCTSSKRLRLSSAVTGSLARPPYSSTSSFFFSPRLLLDGDGGCDVCAGAGAENSLRRAH